MRNYENSANDFNSYRSGRERSRLDDSQSAYNRDSYSGRAQDSSSYGTNYGNRSTYGSQQNQGSSPYSSSQAGWSPESNYGVRNQSPGSSWTTQNNPQNRNVWQQPSSHQGSAYNTSNYGSTYGRSQDQNRDIFDRAGEAIERAGNRASEALDRAGNRINNAWDRWTDDDDTRNRSWGSSPQNRYGSSNYGSSNYGSGVSNYGSSNYGSGSSNYGPSNYGSGSSNYGGVNRSSSYDQDRYTSRRPYTSNYETDRDNDRNVFERMGDTISNAWDRVTGDEEDRNYNYNQNRNRWTDSDRDRSRSTRGSSSYGPPYSTNSASERDYEW